MSGIGKGPPPSIPPRPDKFPPRLPPRREDMKAPPPVVHSKPTVKPPKADLVEGVLDISKTVLGKLDRAWKSTTTNEAAKVIADLNHIYGAGKNTLPFYGFARHEEVRMPHRGAENKEFLVFATKMGRIFEEQKTSFLKSIEGVKDPVHRNFLLKRFDNYRQNVFVAAAHEMAHMPASETERLFSEFNEKNSKNEGKTFADEVKQVLAAEAKGVRHSKGDWSSKIHNPRGKDITPS